MADEENTEEVAEEAVAEDVKPEKGKGVMLLIALSVLVMVLTPAITIFAVKAMSEDDTVEAEKELKDTFELTLPKIHVNVKDTNGTRYAQIEIVLEVSDESVLELFQDKTPETPRGQLKRVMSTVIGIVSDKNLNELLTRDAKTQLAEEIVEALNELLELEASGIVTDVYFYGFLIQ